MKIPREIAQEIVEEISTEINEHINFMNEEGIIIASTDPKRIGVLHEGAQKIITEKLPELYITPEMETKTTRCGINLPLIVEDEIVGVIGITGKKKRVAKYGNIVRRMTEIMVEASIQNETRRYDRRVIYRFLDEWVTNENINSNPIFISRGHSLGIDVTRSYRVMVLYFTDFTKLSATMLGQRKLDEMEQLIRQLMAQETGVLYLRKPPKQILLVSWRETKELLALAQCIRENLEQTYQAQIKIGIDSSKNTPRDVSLRLHQAEKAAAIILHGEIDTAEYDHLNIDLFLHDIQLTTMDEYLRKLFPDLSPQEVKTYVSLVEAYFTYDGSLTKISEALFMHKNTLQYKLKKMATITGLDIRRPSQAAPYYMALTFYNILKSIHLTD
ncbi:MAG TPA: helix-turn-helix domain-containing protein [Candidatus Dorea intestinavium]|nr:helix-turn-helix domain-containing protein [Candidatus Dorea intestinavium]